MNSYDERVASTRKAIDEKRAVYEPKLARAETGTLSASDQRKADAELLALAAEITKLEQQAERWEAIADARVKVPVHPSETVPRSSFPATPRGMFNEQVYHPENTDKFSFVRDIVFAAQDPSAQERLRVNQTQVMDELLRTRGDITTGSGADGFVPPLYLQNLWADVARPGRPFADALNPQPLPESGMTVTVPRLTTGPTVGSQAAEADAVNETDADSDTVTAPVVTIAGQEDVSMQAFERLLPQFDTVILQSLSRAYDAEVDRQLINGTGSSGQLRGLLNVGSPNTVAYTTGSPTGVLALKAIANAIQKVESNRYGDAQAIVMHPRRAADLVSSFDTSNPVLPQSSPVGRALGSAGGTQPTILGLPVIKDANVPTNTGAGTNQDTIYVVRLDDLLFWEQPLRLLRHTQVLSGTLQVRLQTYTYAAAMLDRYPKAITAITGTGLTAPTFT